jgi:hypothetical protein
MLLVTEKDAAPPPGDAARHGVTPPMRDARQRHFRVQPDVPPALVAKTEQDLLAILAVRSLCAFCPPRAASSAVHDSKSLTSN